MSRWEDGRAILVESPGGLATVQDLGRPGWQAQGVSPGGAADRQALRVGNLLLGNPEGSAALECALVGPRLRFNADTWICLTGAGVVGLPAWRPWRIGAGELVDCARLAAGSRLYVCVAGGIEVPRVLDSCATHLAGHFGGLEGRALRRGDWLAIGREGTMPAGLERVAASRGLIPDYAPQARVHVWPGPQHGWFSREAWEQFLATEYRVRAESDRMGVRLEGPPLARTDAREMISEPVAAGTVQVPPDGRPIVLLADRQTLGGYPKLATIVSVDRPVVAQLRPGDTVRFTAVSRREAEARHAASERALAMLRTGASIRASSPA